MKNHTPAIRASLDRLRDVILRTYPDATFSVGGSPDDPEAVHLYVLVDIDDPEDALDLVVDLVAELQIEHGQPIFVIPLRPPAIVSAQPLLSAREPAAS